MAAILANDSGAVGYRYVVRIASLSRFTMSGSRWSKKLLVLVSSVAIAAMSSGLSSKSKTSKFSAMRSARTDFGIATTPRWVSQRRTTWATDLLVFLGDRDEHLVLEEVVLAFRERPPGFDLHAVLLQELLGLDLLVERVGFDLVDRRGDVVVDDQVHHAVGVEVADADGADPALPVERLHVPPGAVDVAVRLVDQVEVQVVQSQPLQRPLERAPGAVPRRRPRSRAWW